MRMEADERDRGRSGKTEREPERSSVILSACSSPSFTQVGSETEDIFALSNTAKLNQARTRSDSSPATPRFLSASRVSSARLSTARDCSREAQNAVKTRRVDLSFPPSQAPS